MSGCLFEWDGGAIPDFKTATFQTCPGVSINDEVSSYSGITDDPSGRGWVQLWVDANGKGAIFCIRPGAAGNVPSKFNDKFSSGNAHYALSRNDKAVGC